MLIKKSYGDRQKRFKQRNWQLQMMDREMDATMATANQDAAEQDYHEFLEDLEEDKNYRKNINIFYSQCTYIPLVTVRAGDNVQFQVNCVTKTHHHFVKCN